MRINISTVSLILILLLNGCGGGGGGTSSSSTTTTSPSIFTTGKTMAYLRHLLFDGSYLYVVDSESLNTLNSYGHLRQFGATSGNFVTTYENATTNFEDIYSVTKFNGDLLVTANYVISGGTVMQGVLKISAASGVYTYSKPYPSSNSLYGLAADSNYLYIADQSAAAIIICTTAYSCSSITSTWVKPTGLAYDGSSYIYVTDYSPSATKGLYKISTSSHAVTSVSSSLFNQPNGVAVYSSTGDVYVVNTGTGDTDSSILKITSAGVVSTFLDGSVTSNMLCKPIGAAISGSYLYITNGICTTNSTYASSVIKISL